MVTSGTWGFGRWGSQLWGWSSFGVLASGNLITDALIKAINQNEPVKQEISATILIDSVDQSEFLENFQVKNSSIGASKIASITFASSAVALTNRVSVIEIYFNYLISGDEFSCLIFKGKPRSIITYPGRVSRSTVVTAYDDSRVLDENAPKTVLYAGSAINLVRSELAALGITAVESRFVDYAIWGAELALDCTQFKTVRELINYVLSGKIKCYAFMGSDGIFRIIEALQVIPSGLAIPLTGQTKNDPIEGSGGVYNRVVVAGRSFQYTRYTDHYDEGSFVETTSEVITVTIPGAIYNDAPHQAVNGILELDIGVAPYDLHYQDALIYALQLANESQCSLKSLEIPLNPFFDIGQGIEFENPDKTVSYGRIEELSQSFNWPSGAWQTMKIREIPTAPSLAGSNYDSIPIILRIYPGADWTITGPQVTTRNLPSGTALLTGDARYPTFTISANKKIHYIAMFIDPEPDTATVILENLDTTEEFSFTLSSVKDWGKLEFESVAGVEITAGDYRFKNEDSGWLMLAKTKQLIQGDVTTSVLCADGQWRRVVNPGYYLSYADLGYTVTGPGICIVRGADA